MNPKIEKITAEIEKLRGKIGTYQTRLRDLERQKTEIENADILAMVRGIDVAPDEFAAFVKMFKAQQTQQDGAVPDLPAAVVADDEVLTQNDKEDLNSEN